MTTAFTVRREGETLVEGELRHVFVDVATMRKTEIPDVMREALTPYLGGGAVAADVA
jgi:acyl-CoA thioesterase FadM